MATDDGGTPATPDAAVAFARRVVADRPELEGMVTVALDDPYVISAVGRHELARRKSGPGGTG